ncbi:MAG: DUF4595 domain-containing protein [Dysgonomonas sp.]|nr:DUF4595 domain-containing protein [Dysgonomonas sp.]
MKKLISIILSVLVLYSCSSDDPLTDTGGNSKPQRRITKIERSNIYGNRTETFSYDSQGRWIGYKRIYSDGEVLTETLSYSGNTIIYSGDNFSTVTFELKNNVIVSRSKKNNNGSTPYLYSNGYWMKIGEDYGDFEYTNGNLTKVIEGGAIYNITYTDYPDKMGFCPYEVSYNDTAIGNNPANILYQFGYFGKKSKNLIESVSSTWGDKMNYSYKFDNEGYVTEIVEKETYQGITETTTYKIFYE